ncbi:hypothetical protein AB0L80_42890 [Streptomyces sp. NPDC052069]|uniref:hypothetical protein n=1 Tax=unclassified Streptomyces TaxID=2593676 RepID=UPI002E76AF2C|nr:hypothetical protein [Streptomyces sp. BE147]MEE1735954.1 hypothetical protein [Streptomyces sp. BE147]
MTPVLGLWFLAAACFGFAGLCSVCLREVPTITGTVAVIVTLAALGLAILH